MLRPMRYMLVAAVAALALASPATSATVTRTACRGGVQVRSDSLTLSARHVAASGIRCPKARAVIARYFRKMMRDYGCAVDASNPPFRCALKGGFVCGSRYNAPTRRVKGECHRRAARVWFHEHDVASA